MSPGATLPASPTTKPRRAHVMKGGELRQELYARIAAQFDALKLDCGMRVALNLSPSWRWFYERSYANNFTIVQRELDGHRVVVRIK